METIHESNVEGVEIFRQFHNIQTWSVPHTFSGILFVVSLYLLVAKRVLPYYMKSRPPFQLKNTLLVYNAFQVAFSIYLVFIYLRYIYNYNVITTRCPQGTDLQGVINEIYPYFIAKHLDLLDTVFFVLRKKDNQVTFLHLYHHTTMVTWTWLHLMHHPSDHFVVVGMLNSFVHVLMYTYYGIASLGPKYAKYIWWKKHLTKVQLIQFILVVSHLHYQQKLSPCPIPAFFHYFCMSLISSFFVLFMKFYFNSYNSKKMREEKNNDFSFVRHNVSKNYTQTWPLPHTLAAIALVISIYLLIVTRILPSYMKNRQPFQLKNVLLVYNASQVALSSYTFYIYINYIYNYNVITTRCPRGADMEEVINKIYPYFVAKHLDLLDTVFFVLRKKDSQVTFLHLHHHAVMITWAWLYHKYHPCDNFVVVGMLNSFAHMLMYGYYGIASLGPKYAKYIWWKKHLTKVQLVQFILGVTHLHYQQKLSPCPVPTLFHYFCMIAVCSFFVLFLKFYVSKYQKITEGRMYNKNFIENNKKTK